MSNPSPAVLINGAPGPFSATASQAITVTLANSAGVANMNVVVIGTDISLPALPAITTNQTTYTSTFNMTGTGTSLLMKCTVNNGINASGLFDQSLSTTFKVYVPDGYGNQKVALGEHLEAGPTGWLYGFGASGGGSFTASHDLSGGSSSQTVIGMQGNPIKAISLGSANDGYQATWVNSDGYVEFVAPIKQYLVNFTTSTTWTSPATCQPAGVLFGYGGGGGGGGGQGGGQGNSGAFAGGGGGGAGALPASYIFALSPNTAYTVTIGAGGNGGTGGVQGTTYHLGGSGSIGGTSKFGTVVWNGGSGGSLGDGYTALTAYGGQPFTSRGANVFSSTLTSPQGGGNGSAGATAANASNGADAAIIDPASPFQGGLGGSSLLSGNRDGQPGGGGGSGVKGNGGSGGGGVSYNIAGTGTAGSTGSSPTANSGAGAGGGSAGANGSTNGGAGGNGGNGGSGQIWLAVWY